MTPVIAFGGVAFNLLLAATCYFVVVRRSGRGWLIYMGLGHLLASLSYAMGLHHYGIDLSEGYVQDLVSTLHALGASCIQASARAFFLIGIWRLFRGPIPLRHTVVAMVSISATIAATYALIGAQTGYLVAGLISNLCFVIAGARLFAGVSMFHWFTGISLILRAILVAVLTYGVIHPLDAQMLDSLLVLTFACIAMTGFGILLIELDDICQRLLEADSAKTMFLASMSHELRTPLNAIIGFSELLGMSRINGTADDNRRYASYILDAGRSLLGVVEQVLHFTALCTGTTKVAREPVSIDRVLDESVELLRERATKKAVEIKYQRPPFKIWLDTDHIAVCRIFSNLIRRAVDVSAAGSSVIVRVKFDERFCFIELEDDARGPETTSLRRIFKSFGQVEDAYTSDKSSLGLEMAITHQLLKAIGAKVLVRSNAGGGSRILVRIPATREPEDAVLPLARAG